MPTQKWQIQYANEEVINPSFKQANKIANNTFNPYNSAGRLAVRPARQPANQASLLYFVVAQLPDMINDFN